MERIYDKCCGVDVHQKLIVACFRSGSEEEIREFSATASSLLGMADWLKDSGCKIVAMESTSSYWKPLYNILEAYDLEPLVVNIQRLKAVPGRKSDVSDAQWIADLLQHGLLRASFIPDKDQCELREMILFRKSLVQERVRALNRIQEILEWANINLSGIVGDIDGKSARNILEYIIAGVTIDEAKYDEMYDDHEIAHDLKATKEQIIDALNGVMSPVQRSLMRMSLDYLDELDKHISRLDDVIDREV